MKEIYLVVTPFFPTPNSFRGPFIYDQVRAIRQNSDFEVIVFNPTLIKDQRDYYQYNQEKVFLFKTKQTPSNLFTGFFDKYNCNSLIKSIKANDIDITKIRYVHCHTMPFGIYGLALKSLSPKIKVIVQHHSRDPYSLLYGKLAGWRPNLNYKYRHSLYIAENTDLHVCVSKLIRDNLLRFPNASSAEDYSPYIKRISPLKKCKSTHIKDSYVLYNGVDVTKFYPTNINNQKICKTFDIHIGCIANFQELKDQISLIKSIKLILATGVKPKLTLVGTGPTLVECKQFVKNNGLTEYISFEQEVDHSLLNSFYNQLDLFVLPSVYEGFGCVFTEAYASGVPFMICEGQGATEYISEEEIQYWVLKKHSPEDIANKIIRFYKDKPSQTLKYPFDINLLIKAYIEKIQNL